MKNVPRVEFKFRVLSRFTCHVNFVYMSLLLSPGINPLASACCAITYVWSKIKFPPPYSTNREMFSATHGDDDGGRLCLGLEAIYDLTNEFITA